MTSAEPAAPRGVFCSYAHADSERVRPFVTRLREEGGIDAWLDVWEIEAGDDIGQ